MYHNYNNNVEVVNEITAPEPPEVSTLEECFGANTTLQETILDFPFSLMCFTKLL
jgi:hypothetical protein